MNKVIIFVLVTIMGVAVAGKGPSNIKVAKGGRAGHQNTYSLHDILPNATDKVDQAKYYNSHNINNAAGLTDAANSQAATKEGAQTFKKIRDLGKDKNVVDALKAMPKKIDEITAQAGSIDKSAYEGIECADGSCVEESPDSSDEYVGAVAKLDAVLGASKDRDTLTNSFFKGVAMSCHKFDAGNVDCCNFDRWNASCTKEEKELYEAFKDKKAVFVTSRKSGKTRWKKETLEYCVFKTRMAKVVQEQGRAHARAPLESSLIGSYRKHRKTRFYAKCDGLSAKDLEKIPLDKLNYDDVASDELGKYRDPNASDMIEKVKQRAGELVK